MSEMAPFFLTLVHTWIPEEPRSSLCMDINDSGVSPVPLATSLTSSLLASENALNSTSASKYAVSLTELIISFTWFSYQFFAYFAMIMPSKLFLILSSTFHVTFSVYSLCFVLSIIITLAYTYIRYKYLTVYSRLPKDAKRQNPVIDTFVDANPKEKRNESKSYLDEFLSAIKIFGYLDSSVFHELTKSLQTQKLDSGEIIFLGELNGFTICVEGELQVYSKVNNEDQAKRSIFYKEDDRNVVIVDGARYQLLNIIKSGSPLSSIISVLDLFTDSGQTIASVTPTPYTIIDEHQTLPLDGFSLDPLQQLSNGRNESSVIPEMIAIPKGNCTISIIPKESFTKIAARFPKDASHIIQMILAKLYRVTFQTAHNYLDLTPDIYQTEINVNINASKKISRLPKYLHDLAVSIINRDDQLNNSDEQLNNVNRIISRVQKTNELSNGVTERRGRKFNTQRNRSFTDSNNYRTSSASGSPSLMTNTKSAPTKTNQPFFLSSDADADADAEIDESTVSSDNTNNFDFSRPRLPKKKSRHIVLDSLSTNNPGDLFSNVPLPRGDGEMNLKLSTSNLQKKELLNRTFTSDIDEDETEQSTLKIALAERISRMIGLDKNNFPLTQDSNQYSLSGPTLNGIKYITADAQNNIPENLSNGNSKRNKSFNEYSKLRSFSTNSMDSLNVDNDLTSTHSSDINRTIINFENFKYEFCNDIKLKKIAKGTTIVKTRETTPGLFYVIRGGLDVTYQKRENSYIDSYYSNTLQDTEKSSNMGFTDEYLHHVNEGEVAGYLGTLIGSKSFVDIKTSEDTYVAFLPREFFEFLSEKHPRVELSFANHLLKVLEKKLYFTDYSLEWMHQSAGNLLYVQGEPANGIYIVLNGRFRAITKPDNSKDEYQILGEFGQGESMGEIEVLTKSNRLSSVVAIRDGEIARIPRTLFELVAMTNPSIMVNVSRIVANRVNRDGILMANTFNSSLAPATHIQDEPAVQNFNNYRTLTIMPTTYGAVPVEEFAEKLALALEKVGKRVKLLNQSTVLTSLGRYAFDKLAKLKQSGFFSEIEEKYDIVIYLSDASSNSNWTQTCIQQGDCILLLANAQLSPDIGEYERLLVKTKTTARTELILLHPERFVEPGQTNKWLKNRIWVHSHHHVQMLCGKPHLDDGIAKSRLYQFDALTLLSKKFTENIKTFIEGNEFIQSQISLNSKKYYQPMQEHKNDFMRLARLLTGQAIGLVLGGGGARGISHVGVLKALEDQGIPVDIVGGTSIGAFVGGLYAKDYDFVPVYGRAKTFSSRMASIWRSILDLTIPITSYITGHEFNRGIWKAFGDSRIEDFWITYYTNSTNLTQSVMEIHTSGYAWRYIRASMTLASLLPPMTDNGNMLMDGGYIDNLTVSEMERRGVRRIIACDVGSEDEKSLMQYGDSLSGFWVLFNRLNPFSSHPNVPTMADIQMKLAYVASVSALEKAKKTKGVVYLRPPIDGYATLDFGKFDEIYKVGLKYVNGIKDKISDVLIVNSEQDKGFVANTKRTRRYSM